MTECEACKATMVKADTVDPGTFHPTEQVHPARSTCPAVSFDGYGFDDTEKNAMLYDEYEFIDGQWVSLVFYE